MRLSLPKTLFVVIATVLLVLASALLFGRSSDDPEKPSDDTAIEVDGPVVSSADNAVETAPSVTTSLSARAGEASISEEESSPLREMIHVSGIVRNAKTGNPVPDVEIRGGLVVSSTGFSEMNFADMTFDFTTEAVISDAYGAFSIDLPKEPTAEDLRSMAKREMQTAEAQEMMRAAKLAMPDLEDDLAIEALIEDNLNYFDGIMFDGDNLGAGMESRWTLKSIGEGFAVSKVLVPESSGLDVHVDIELLQGYSIAGRVVDNDTGEGIVGAEINVAPFGGYAASAMETPFEESELTATDEEGNYSLSNLVEGSYTVHVDGRSLGYIPLQSNKASVTLWEGSPVASLDFQFIRGAVVQGWVVDSDGNPVEEVFLTAIRKDNSSVFSFDTEDMFSDFFISDPVAFPADDGFFEIIGLDFDTEYFVEAEHDDFATHRSENFHISVGGNAPTLRLVMTQGTTISGRARYANGRPATDISVFLEPEESENSLNFMSISLISEDQDADTDAQGRYIFEHVAAGEYTIGSGASWMAKLGGEDTKTRLNITADGVNDLYVRDLIVTEESEKKDEGFIEGRVLDPSGAPAAGAKVSASPAVEFMVDLEESVTTEDDGSFRITGLSMLFGTDFDVEAVSAEGRAVLKRVALGAKVTIRLNPPVNISGVVVDARGNTVASAHVRYRPTENSVMREFMGAFGGESYVGRRSTASDAMGRFLIPNVERGSHELLARSDTKGTGEVAVTVQDRSVDVRIVLEPYVRVSGRVYDPAGRVVEGCTVTLHESADSPAASFMSAMMPVEFQESVANALTDKDGAFLMLNVPPGSYTLAASHRDYARAVLEDLNVPAGTGLERVDITLSNGGAIVGEYIVDGTPRAGVMIELMGGKTIKTAMTDEEGRFEFSSLAYGAYLLMAMDITDFDIDDDTSMSVSTPFSPRSVQVNEGETTEVVLGTTDGVTVKGVVVADDIPANTIVVLRSVDAPELDPGELGGIFGVMGLMMTSVEVDMDGSFTIENVLPGEYRIEIYTDIQEPGGSEGIGEFDIENFEVAFEQFMESIAAPRLSQEIVVGEDGLTIELTLPDN